MQHEHKTAYAPHFIKLREGRLAVNEFRAGDIHALAHTK